jgi:hypothetical protein
MAGENLAVNFVEAESVGAAWMNSAGHKANILNKNFEDIGIGIAQGEYQGHMAIFVVQMFGTLAEQKITLSETPVEQKAETPAPVVQTNLNLPASAPVDLTEFPPVPKVELVSAKADITLDSNVLISARTNESAVKVLAYFGQQAIMLSPKDGYLWQGQVELSKLANAGQTVNIKAYDLKGAEATKLLADFAASTVGNFNVLGATQSPKVSWLGRVFDPKLLEHKAYLLFMAAMLSCLVLAVAIHRHVQHLSLIANSSFVIMLASLLWISGGK